MKKLILLLVAAGGLSLASCTKQYNQVVPNQTVYKDIATADWSTSDGGKNYSTFYLPPSANDNFGLESDGVLVYFTFDGGHQYEQIPEVYNNVSYSYTVSRDTVWLYAQSANGSQVIDAPPALTAKTILVPSN